MPNPKNAEPAGAQPETSTPATSPPKLGVARMKLHKFRKAEFWESCVGIKRMVFIL